MSSEDHNDGPAHARRRARRPLEAWCEIMNSLRNTLLPAGVVVWKMEVD